MLFFYVDSSSPTSTPHLPVTSSSSRSCNATFSADCCFCVSLWVASAASLARFFFSSSCFRISSLALYAACEFRTAISNRLVIGSFVAFSFFGSQNLTAFCVARIPIMLSSDILVLCFDTTLLSDSPVPRLLPWAITSEAMSLTTFCSAGYLSLPVTSLNSKTLLQKWQKIQENIGNVQKYRKL